MTESTGPRYCSGRAGGDPTEDRLRETIRATVGTMFEEELARSSAASAMAGAARKGFRHGRRERQLVGTFGTETVSVPGVRASRARMAGSPNGARRRCRATSG